MRNTIITLTILLLCCGCMQTTVITHKAVVKVTAIGYKIDITKLFYRDIFGLERAVTIPDAELVGAAAEGLMKGVGL